MASPTTNLKLLRPGVTEPYNLETINNNLDNIDTFLGNTGAHREYGTSLTSGSAVVASVDSDYTATTRDAIRYGNWAYLRIRFTFNKAVTINQYGEMTTPIFGIVAPKWKPLVASPMYTVGSGRGVDAYINSAGGITLRHAAGITNYAIGDIVDIAGWYMLADEA